MSKTIPITGASSGFGRDTAETLFRAGHTVYASMRRAQGKNREAAEAPRKLGIKIVASAQRIMNGPLVAFPRVGFGARKSITLSISKNQEGQVMKINMKKHLAVAMMGLLLGFASSALAQNQTSGGSTPSDPQIVGIVTAADRIDIDAGRLALNKSKNDQVKQFAQQMIDDHTNLQKSVDELGKKLNVAPAESDTGKALNTQAAAEMKKLRGLRGKDFDSEYINNEVAFHQQVLDAAGKVLIPSAQNAELKSALQDAAPLLQGHLQHAQQLQSSMGGSSSSGGSGNLQ